MGSTVLSTPIVIRKTTSFRSCCITWFLIATGLTLGLGISLSMSRTTKCSLVYDGRKGVITEAMMERWANSVDWSFTHPTADEYGCKCANNDLNDQGFFDSSIGDRDR